MNKNSFLIATCAALFAAALPAHAQKTPVTPKDVAAAPKDAEKTKSGLKSKVLKAGKGAKPKATDTVTVHY
ncbi:hypothetical protein N9B40_02605, partial [Akkermansiaceae bacterium]|nr:hypothetical protein [Akkermansiaceae bacterium]